MSERWWWWKGWERCLRGKRNERGERVSFFEVEARETRTRKAKQHSQLLLQRSRHRNIRPPRHSAPSNSSSSRHRRLGRSSNLHDAFHLRRSSSLTPSTATPTLVRRRRRCSFLLIPLGSFRLETLPICLQGPTSMVDLPLLKRASILSFSNGLFSSDEGGFSLVQLGGSVAEDSAAVRRKAKTRRSQSNPTSTRSREVREEGGRERKRNDPTHPFSASFTFR